jgi:hypothetical protein
VRPWDGTGDPLDVETQRACYTALLNALDGATWIGGVFFGRWDSGGGGGATDPSSTPRGKPAADVLSRAYRSWNGRPVYVPPVTTKR